MFHNTEDNRKPPNGLGEQTIPRGSKQHAAENPNSFSQDQLRQNNLAYAAQKQQKF
jgi:hypothetical protein